MRWLIAATICLVVGRGGQAAQQIVGNAYQYPLPGGGSTTFIKGPAYESHIDSLLAEGHRGLPTPTTGRGVANVFHFAPHGTFPAQGRPASPGRVLQPFGGVGLFPHGQRAVTHVSHGVVQPHPLVHRLVHQPGVTLNIRGLEPSVVPGNGVTVIHHTRPAAGAAQPTTLVAPGHSPVSSSFVNAPVPALIHRQPARGVSTTYFSRLAPPVFGAVSSSAPGLTPVGVVHRRFFSPAVTNVVRPVTGAGQPVVSADVRLARPAAGLVVPGPLAPSRNGAVPNVRVSIPSAVSAPRFVVRVPGHAHAGIFSSTPTVVRSGPPASTVLFRSPVVGQSPVVTYASPGGYVRLSSPATVSTLGVPQTQPGIVASARPPLLGVAPLNVHSPIARPAGVRVSLLAPARPQVIAPVSTVSHITPPARPRLPGLLSLPLPGTVVSHAPVATRLVTQLPARTAVRTPLPLLTRIVGPTLAAPPRLATTVPVTSSLAVPVGTRVTIPAKVVTTNAAAPTFDVGGVPAAERVIINAARPLVSSVPVATPLAVSGRVPGQIVAAVPLGTRVAAPFALRTKVAAAPGLAVTRFAGPTRPTFGYIAVPGLVGARVVSPTFLGGPLVVPTSIATGAARPIVAPTFVPPAIGTRVITSLAPAVTHVAGPAPAVTRTAAPSPVITRVAGPVPVVTRPVATPLAVSERVPGQVVAAVPLGTRVATPFSLGTKVAASGLAVTRFAGSTQPTFGHIAVPGLGGARVVTPTFLGGPLVVPTSIATGVARPVVAQTFVPPAAGTRVITGLAPAVTHVAGPALTVTRTAAPSPVVTRVAGPVPVVTRVAGSAPVAASGGGPASVVTRVDSPVILRPGVSGPALLGSRLTGPALLGPRLTGPALLGPRLVGPGVAGPTTVVTRVAGAGPPVVNVAGGPASVITAAARPSPVVTRLSFARPATVPGARLAAISTPVGTRTTAHVVTNVDPAPALSRVLVPTTRVTYGVGPAAPAINRVVVPGSISTQVVSPAQLAAPVSVSVAAPTVTAPCTVVCPARAPLSLAAPVATVTRVSVPVIKSADAPVITFSKPIAAPVSISGLFPGPASVGARVPVTAPLLGQVVFPGPRTVSPLSVVHQTPVRPVPTLAVTQVTSHAPGVIHQGTPLLVNQASRGPVQVALTPAAVSSPVVTTHRVVPAQQVTTLTPGSSPTASSGGVRVAGVPVSTYVYGQRPAFGAYPPLATQITVLGPAALRTVGGPTLFGAIPAEAPDVSLVKAAPLAAGLPSVEQIRTVAPLLTGVTSPAAVGRVVVHSPLTSTGVISEQPVLTSGPAAATAVRVGAPLESTRVTAAYPVRFGGPAQHGVRVPAAVLTRVAAPVAAPLVTRTSYAAGPGVPGVGIVSLGTPSFRIRTPDSRYRSPVTGFSSSVFTKQVQVPVHSSLAGLPAAIQVSGPGMAHVSDRYATALPAAVVARLSSSVQAPVISRVSVPTVSGVTGQLSAPSVRPALAAVGLNVPSATRISSPAFLSGAPLTSAEIFGPRYTTGLRYGATLRGLPGEAVTSSPFVRLASPVTNLGMFGTRYTSGSYYGATPAVLTSGLGPTTLTRLHVSSGPTVSSPAVRIATPFAVRPPTATGSITQAGLVTTPGLTRSDGHLLTAPRSGPALATLPNAPTGVLLENGVSGSPIVQLATRVANVGMFGTRYTSGPYYGGTPSVLNSRFAPATLPRLNVPSGLTVSSPVVGFSAPFAASPPTTTTITTGDGLVSTPGLALTRSDGNLLTTHKTESTAATLPIGPAGLLLGNRVTGSPIVRLTSPVANAGMFGTRYTSGSYYGATPSVLTSGLGPTTLTQVHVSSGPTVSSPTVGIAAPFAVRPPTATRFITGAGLVTAPGLTRFDGHLITAPKSGPTLATLPIAPAGALLENGVSGSPIVRLATRVANVGMFGTRYTSGPYYGGTPSVLTSRLAPATLTRLYHSAGPTVSSSVVGLTAPHAVHPSTTTGITTGHGLVTTPDLTLTKIDGNLLTGHKPGSIITTVPIAPARVLLENGVSGSPIVRLPTRVANVGMFGTRYTSGPYYGGTPSVLTSRFAPATLTRLYHSAGPTVSSSVVGLTAPHAVHPITTTGITTEDGLVTTPDLTLTKIDGNLLTGHKPGSIITTSPIAPAGVLLGNRATGSPITRLDIPLANVGMFGTRYTSGSYYGATPSVLTSGPGPNTLTQLHVSSGPTVSHPVVKISAPLAVSSPTTTRIHTGAVLATTPDLGLRRPGGSLLTAIQAAPVVTTPSIGHGGLPGTVVTGPASTGSLNIGQHVISTPQARIEQAIAPVVVSPVNRLPSLGPAVLTQAAVPPRVVSATNLHLGTTGPAVDVGMFGARYHAGARLSAPHFSIAAYPIASMFGARYQLGLRSQAPAVVTELPGSAATLQLAGAQAPVLGVPVGHRVQASVVPLQVTAQEAALGTKYASGLHLTAYQGPVSPVAAFYMFGARYPQIGQISVSTPQSTLVKTSVSPVHEGSAQSQTGTSAASFRAVVSDAALLATVQPTLDTSAIVGAAKQTTLTGPESIQITAPVSAGSVATSLVAKDASSLTTTSGYAVRVVDAPIAARLTASAQSVSATAGQVTVSGSAKTTVHEIHVSSGPSTVRIEEYKAGGQLIRVHEQPQPPPEVLNVDGPAPRPSVVRIVSKSKGPVHIERVVHEGGTEVYDVHKPAPAPERIVQIERGPRTPPHVEVTHEETPSPVVPAVASVITQAAAVAPAAVAVVPSVVAVSAPAAVVPSAAPVAVPAVVVPSAAPVAVPTAVVPSAAPVAVPAAVVPSGVSVAAPQVSQTVVANTVPAGPTTIEVQSVPATAVAGPVVEQLAAPAVVATAAAAVPVVTGRKLRRRPLLRGGENRSSLLVRVAAAPAANVNALAASGSAALTANDVVGRRIVPPGAYGRRLRRKKVKSRKAKAAAAAASSSSSSSSSS